MTKTTVTEAHSNSTDKPATSVRNDSNPADARKRLGALRDPMRRHLA